MDIIQLILRYTGQGAVPFDDLRRVLALLGCRVIEESGKMVVLEAAKANAEKLLTMIPDWIVTPLRSDIRLPDPRPRPKRSPPRKK